MSIRLRRPVFRLLCSVAFAFAVVACGGDAESPTADTTSDVAVEVDADGSGEDTGEDVALPDVDAPDTADEDAPDAIEEDVTPALPCETDSAVGLAGCVEQARWEADMAAMPTPRIVGTSSWQAAQDLCAERFEELGFNVVRDDWGGGVNVIGTLPGASLPGEVMVIGAHYDTEDAILPGGGYCPGADDNWSAVAGMFEAARVLASIEHPRTLVVACWDREEAGLLGSRIHAQQLAAAGTPVVAAVALEMIGFASDEPGSQVLPDGFSLFFPETVEAMDAREWRGDFIAAIGDLHSLPAIEALEAIGEQTGVDVVRVAVPLEFRSAVALADLRRSDHGAFWDRNYPAIMLTDTANFRNPNYHCVGGIDSVDTLDASFAAGVIANLTGAAFTLLSAELTPTTPTNGRACSGVSQDGCGDGERCSLINIAVVGPVEACVPVLGEVPVGETCTRTGFGEGDCAAGGACTTYERTFNEDGSAPAPACRALCEGSSDCGEGERCQSPGSNPFSGVCVTNCSPASSDDCPENSRCLLAYGVGDRVLGGVCTGPDDPQALDAACETELSCGSGLACAHDTGTCRPYCDGENACGDGQECVPYPLPTSIEGLGYCQPL